MLQFFKREEQIAAINKFCTGTIVPKILDTKLLFSCDKNIGGFPHIFFSSNYTNKTNTVILDDTLNICKSYFMSYE